MDLLIQEMGNANTKTQVKNIGEMIEEIKVDIHKEIEYKTEGAICRSRIKWYEEGEHNRQYFISLEKL